MGNRTDFGSAFHRLDKHQRVMRCSLVLYCPEDFMLDVLSRRRDFLREWAYIVHDKDEKYCLTDKGDKILNPDGSYATEKKETHIHLLLFFNRQVLVSSIYRWFFRVDEDGLEETVMILGIGDCSSAVAYLTHRYYPDKYQYPEQAVYKSSAEFFANLDYIPDDPIVSATLEFYAGANPMDLVKRYGRDFIHHFSSIRSICVYSNVRKDFPPSAFDDPLSELYAGK